jgi:hypothetical protein
MVLSNCFGANGPFADDKIRAILRRQMVGAVLTVMLVKQHDLRYALVSLVIEFGKEIQSITTEIMKAQCNLTDCDRVAVSWSLLPPADELPFWLSPFWLQLVAIHRFGKEIQTR